MSDIAAARAYVELAIDEVNELGGNGHKIQKSDDFALLGSDNVDSLGFISLISSIESVIQEKTSKFVTLVDEDALTGGGHPFATVGTLVAYVAKALD